jgi:ankyrin repeat protein
MKKLFTSIRNKDLITVKSILDDKPSLLTSVSTGTPKKDIGQSPLQIALKSSSTEIVNYLLDKGADVNFMESEEIQTWRCPVIHDAINRAIMTSRWNVNRSGQLDVFNTEKDADESFNILKRIMDLGADVNAKDSYGNSCLNRACLQSRQILPAKDSDDRILTNELKADISRIFNILIENGADLNYISPNTSGKTCAEFYKNDTVGIFLKLLENDISRII